MHQAANNGDPELQPPELHAAESTGRSSSERTEYAATVHTPTGPRRVPDDIPNDGRDESVELRSSTPDALQSSRDRFAFLAETSRYLAESLDYETTLVTVAGMALPYLGAWCIVDIVLPDDEIRRVAVLHPDAARELIARELHERYPPRPDDRIGAPRVIRTGRSELVADVSDAAMEMVARDAKHLRLLRALGLGAYVIVPMVARHRVVGAITFVTMESGHQFGDIDLLLAEDLASRAAMAVDNARLHAEAVQAKQKAEEASQSKSHFLAVVGHELRTPLSAMAGFAELLGLPEFGALSDTQRTQLEGIRRCQRHMLTLADDILEHARAEAGAMEYALENVRLAEVLTACEAMMASLYLDTDIALEIVAFDQMLTVRADAQKLRQIVLNLLSNACKFTTPGGRTTLMCTAGVDTVDVTVTDSGCGISAHDFARIFEPFVQVQAADAKTHDGVGLGLAISRELARGMGGDLTVSSELGKGSIFTLRLPLA